MTTTQSAKTTIYYTPYVGQYVPLYDGTSFNMTDTGGELSVLTTDATKSPAAVGPNESHDWFVWSDAGTMRVGRSGVWSKTATITVTIATPAVVTWTAHALPEGSPVIFTNSGGALPTGITAGTVYFVSKSPATNTFNISTSLANVAAGTLVATSGSQSGTHTGENRTTTRSNALTMVNGILLNTSAITNGAGASRGTYVGTTMSNGSSQLDWILGGVAANGTAGVFGVWNAYNRVTVSTVIGDNTNSWTYAVANVWRGANASATIRVSFIRGLDEDAATAIYTCPANAGASTLAMIGIGVNSTTAFSGATGLNASASAAVSFTAAYGGLPGLGYNFISAIELNSTTTASTYYGAFGLTTVQSGINVTLRM